MDDLGPGETVVYRARQHPIILLWPAVVLTLGCFLNYRGVGGFGIIVTGIGIIWCGLVAIRLRTSEAVLTNRRVVLTSWLEGRSLSLPLNKIDTIGVEGKALVVDSGTLVIGRGGTTERFSRMARAAEFCRMARREMGSE